MFTRALTRLALVVLLAAPALAQDPPRPPGMPPFGGDQKKAELPAQRDVKLETSDGLEIAATFWPAEAENAPGVVLLHMFRSTRDAWEPVVKRLRDRGLAILAIDLRGHGDSAVQGKRDLTERVTKRDPKFFSAMHEDAFAAVEWLAQEGGCDEKRIALVGASVGCSVAIDTTRRHPERVAAVLCMTPGAKYLGLDTLSHLESFPEATPLLLLAHRSEMPVGAEKIKEARPATALVIYDDEAPEACAGERAWAHGTKMFGRLPIVDLTVASFVATNTGSRTEDVVLDGVINNTTSAGSDDWTRAVKVSPAGGTGEIRAFRVGRRVLFGGTVPKGYTGLRFEVQSGGAASGGRQLAIGPPQVVCVDLAAGRWVWSRGGMASIPNLPGMDSSTIFGKTQPVLRVVHGEEKTSFEGEWTVPSMMGESEGAVRLYVRADREPNPRPGAGVAAALDQAVDLPSR